MLHNPNFTGKQKRQRRAINEEFQKEVSTHVPPVVDLTKGYIGWLSSVEMRKNKLYDVWKELELHTRTNGYFPFTKTNLPRIQKAQNIIHMKTFIVLSCNIIGQFSYHF